jgi:DNA-directed RNA polymerase specialized sigma24 family protein
MKTYTVSAVPWEHGWELHIDGEGVTQTRTLDKAAGQVRDYLASLHGGEYKDAEVIVEPGIRQRELIATAKAHARAAAQMQMRASQEMREAVQQLRADGYSVTDAAALLGISRGRVSQLIR